MNALPYLRCSSGSSATIGLSLSSIPSPTITKSLDLSCNSPPSKEPPWPWLPLKLYWSFSAYYVLSILCFILVRISSEGGLGGFCVKKFVPPFDLKYSGTKLGVSFFFSLATKICYIFYYLPSVLSCVSFADIVAYLSLSFWAAIFSLSAWRAFYSSFFLFFSSSASSRSTLIELAVDPL